MDGYCRPSGSHRSSRPARRRHLFCRNRCGQLGRGGARAQFGRAGRQRRRLLCALSAAVGEFTRLALVLVLIGVCANWQLSGFFRFQPEGLGFVLRFGKHVRTVQPGLNYHLPYPIETVLLPKALRVSTISIGMTLIDDPARRGRTMRDVPEESLMLTGDENIVDVDFTVLWRIKPDGVGDYLFNIQNPEGTVKAVAESAMREAVGKA